MNRGWRREGETRREESRMAVKERECGDERENKERRGRGTTTVPCSCSSLVFFISA